MTTAMTIAQLAPALEAHAPPGFLPWVAWLVHGHRDRLLRYARRRGLDAEEALDAVQECFASFLSLPAARSIARDGDDAPRLLTVLLRHGVQNHRRKRARRVRAQPLLEAVAPGAAESSEALVARAEALARVNGCVLRMARLQRDVVRLSLLDGEPADVIGRRLGVTPGYVRVLLHRAREHVRGCTFSYPDGGRVTPAAVAT